ncbi:MAG: hypothetical protein LH630_04240, partial [Actinomycetia bacterium]|nr:hypothetical protein [Actinomycetes bacterium]
MLGGRFGAVCSTSADRAEEDSCEGDDHEAPLPFELGVVCEVFGIDRSASGLPMLDFAVVSE